MIASEFIEEVHSSVDCPEKFDDIYKEFQEYQSIAIHTLNAFDEVCRKANVIYTLAYGSLLGAIRDKGQIPWDYDIDVFVKCSDRKKLVEALKEYLSGEFYFFSPETHKKCTHTIIRIAPTGLNSVYLHVDVFFLMGISDDEDKAKIQKEKIANLTLLYKGKKYNPFTYNAHITRSELKTVLSYKAKALRMSAQSIWEEYEKESLSYEMTNVDKCCSADRFSGWYDFPSNMMSDIEECRTLSGVYIIPKNYDKILREEYGEYMNVPPVEKRVEELLRHYRFLKKYCPLKA